MDVITYPQAFHTLNGFEEKHENGIIMTFELVFEIDKCIYMYMSGTN